MAVSPMVALSAALLGGLVSLDRTAFGQFLLSRPLPAAGLLGVALGCPYQAVFIGMSLELLFLASLPVGSFIPFNALYPTLIAVTIFAVVDPTNSHWEVIPIAILFALPTVWVDRLVEDLWRRSNDRVVSRAEAFLRLGRYRTAGTLHILSILRGFVLNTGAILVCIWLLAELAALFLKQFPWMPEILSLVGMMPFIVGIAGISAAKVKGFGWAGFAGGLVLGFFVWSGI